MMKKLLVNKLNNGAMAKVVAVAIAFGAGDVLAQSKDELKTILNAPVVQEDLDEPDGASIHLNEDGTFQIFARGTGTYDFNDKDDIADARKVSALRAKAAIAKFMKESICTEDGIAEQSQKTKKLSADGGDQNISVSKETFRQTSEMIKTKTEALIKGAVTLDEQKIPNENGVGGEYQTTIGISSKTLAAVTALTKAIDLTGEQGDFSGHRKSATGANRPLNTTAAQSSTATKPNGFNDANKPQRKKSKSDF